jgi:hypothetical protein
VALVLTIIARGTRSLRGSGPMWNTHAQPSNGPAGEWLLPPEEGGHPDVGGRGLGDPHGERGWDDEEGEHGFGEDS